MQAGYLLRIRKTGHRPGTLSAQTGWPLLLSEMANFRGFWPELASISQQTLKNCKPAQLHPLVAPHVSHFSHVPFRTIVKFWHSEHMLPV